MAFADATHGWAVGAGGTILATIDGGASWHTQSSGTSSALSAVAFADATHGWAVGAAGTILASTDGGTTWTAQSSATTSALSAVTFADAIHGWAVGAGGIIVATTTGGVADTTAPVTTAAGLRSSDSVGWQTTTETVKLAPTDGSGDGVSRVKYAVDGGESQIYRAPFAVSGDGSHTVTYYAIDTAGNAEAPKTGFVNIDTTAPVTATGGLQASDASGWTDASQSFTLTPADAGSGVAATFYSIDGAAAQPYTGTAPEISGDGQHTVRYWSTDALGNAETPKTGYINIDTIAPGAPQDAAASYNATSHSVVVHYTVPDASPAAPLAVTVTVSDRLGRQVADPVTFSGDTPDTAILRQLSGLNLARGSYRVTVSSADAAGNVSSRALSVAFTVH